MSRLSHGADLADALVDRRPLPIGPLKWVGNDYVRISETEDPAVFVVAVVPLDHSDSIPAAPARLEGDDAGGERVVARLRFEALAGTVSYHVDGFTREGPLGWRVTTPWGHRGLLVLATGDHPVSTSIRLDGLGLRGIRRDADLIVADLGRWSLAVVHDGEGELANDSIALQARNVAIGTHIHSQDSIRSARRIAEDPRGVERGSRQAWSRYLSSCPVVPLSELAEKVGSEFNCDESEFAKRQLWHWWAARANVARTVDDSRVYVSPDRGRWHGMWSSDGPLTLCALAMTSERETARDAYLDYLRLSLNSRGHLSWYTHASGSPALGRLGDTGVLSHGLPDVVRAAEFIDRHEPDLALLDAEGVGGRSVYSTLAWYLDSSEDRDINGDGLWETANLWESGWDNKVGPFFSSAPVDDWVDVLGSGRVSTLAEFLRVHQRPVTSMAEQFSHLMALEAMEAMATSRSDPKRAEWAMRKRARVIATISGRHWSPSSSTYRDWDVVNGVLSDADCLDGFYFLAYESDPKRTQALLRVLDNPQRFGLPVAPTLARDDQRYDSGGYWDGSHWPREMHYLAMGLARSGHPSRAARVLVAALTCGRGSEILEHVDSTDGRLLRFHDGGATVVTQAMSVGLCLGLLDIARGDVWWPVRNVEGSAQ